MTRTTELSVSVAWLFAIYSVLVLVMVSAMNNDAVTKEEQRRIVGGLEVERPISWMVSLQEEEESGVFSHRCGGALVSSDWVITSAHCLQNIDRACIGGTDLTKIDEFLCVLLDGFYLHASYEEDTYMNDLAFVRLATPVLNTPARLGDSVEMDAPGEYGIVLGWGVTATGEVSPVLKRLDVEWTNQKECATFGPPIESPVHLSRLCTKPVIGEGPCLGDSGSPAYSIDNGEMVIVGLVSLGSSRCAGNLPTVFMRMSYAVQWIWGFIASPPTKKTTLVNSVSNVNTQVIANPSSASVWHARKHCTQLQSRL
eukprot:CFRG7205T1